MREVFFFFIFFFFSPASKQTFFHCPQSFQLTTGCIPISLSIKILVFQVQLSCFGKIHFSVSLGKWTSYVCSKVKTAKDNLSEAYCCAAVTACSFLEKFLEVSEEIKGKIRGKTSARPWRTYKVEFFQQIIISYYWLGNNYVNQMLYQWRNSNVASGF